MARVTTMSGITSISGRLGAYCFRTMKATGKVYVHCMPSKKDQLRKKGKPKAPSAAMLVQRERFRAITKMVAQMRRQSSKGRAKSLKQLWKIATEAYDAANQ